MEKSKYKLKIDIISDSDTRENTNRFKALFGTSKVKGFVTENTFKDFTYYLNKITGNNVNISKAVIEKIIGFTQKEDKKKYINIIYSLKIGNDVFKIDVLLSFMYDNLVSENDAKVLVDWIKYYGE